MTDTVKSNLRLRPVVRGEPDWVNLPDSWQSETWDTGSPQNVNKEKICSADCSVLKIFVLFKDCAKRCSILLKNHLLTRFEYVQGWRDRKFRNGKIWTCYYFPLRLGNKKENNNREETLQINWFSQKFPWNIQKRISLYKIWNNIYTAPSRILCIGNGADLHNLARSYIETFLKHWQSENNKIWDLNYKISKPSKC